MKAELDYAYLAEYAKAENGTITAVGASFTQVKAHGFPAYLNICAAGRVRRGEGEPDPSLRLSIVPPGGENILEMSFMLTSTEGAVVYDNKVANVFAVSAPISLTQAGLCEVNIYLNHEHVRRLAFEVMDIAE